MLRPKLTAEQRALAARKAINDVDNTPPPKLVKPDIVRALRDV